MRKIKEVLRLRFELGLGQREIARACALSQGAVHNYLKRAAETGMPWPLPEGWDEKRIEEAVFGKQCSIEESSRRAFPDFPALHQQLQQHPHLTLQLAWEEYREKNPEGYRYSWFCELYRQWRGKQDVVLRQEHKAGEKGFVDWAGATIPMQDPNTRGIWQASLFVMVLGASSYTYAEATRDQQLSSWIGSHIHASALTRMVGTVGAMVSFQEGSELLTELAGVPVDAKPVERTAEALGKEIAQDERVHSEPLDALPLPRTLYLGMDGTGIPLRAEELVGRTGKQPDGSAKTGEVKLCTVWSAESLDEQGTPIRDEGSVTYSAALESAGALDTLRHVLPLPSASGDNLRAVASAKRLVPSCSGMGPCGFGTSPTISFPMPPRLWTAITPNNI
jgi:Sigma-70, region 4